jgi:phage terminase small subunit
MAILRNGRHERFAVGLADGLSQEKAYINAGFSPNGARGAACNLIKQFSYILRRRDEILAEREKLHSVSTIQAMKALQITKKEVMGLMEELMNNATIAKVAVPVMKGGVPAGVYTSEHIGIQSGADRSGQGIRYVL